MTLYDDPENFRQKYTCITIREISQQWCCIYHTDEKSWYDERIHEILVGMTVVHMKSWEVWLSYTCNPGRYGCPFYTRGIMIDHW